MARLKKRRAQGGGKESITGINVTPLVDVCLVLVIIFMVTAPILNDPAFKVQLPKTELQEDGEGDKVAVSLAPDGRIAVEDTEVATMEEFGRELQARLDMSQTKQVVFKADQDAAHGRLLELMQAAKSAGANSMTIATERLVR